MSLKAFVLYTIRLYGSIKGFKGPIYRTMNFLLVSILPEMFFFSIFLNKINFYLLAKMSKKDVIKYLWQRVVNESCHINIVSKDVELVMGILPLLYIINSMWI